MQSLRIGFKKIVEEKPDTEAPRSQRHSSSVRLPSHLVVVGTELRSVPSAHSRGQASLLAVGLDGLLVLLPLGVGQVVGDAGVQNGCHARPRHSLCGAVSGGVIKQRGNLSLAVGVRARGLQRNKHGFGGVQGELSLCKIRL